ncbi:MAG: molybdate ABC transporter substrate-binding protein [Actinomycetota bacterium]|nr:molybdate ABC transporter substrate-binding protein [Actinomycetota bacterium]
MTRSTALLAGALLVLSACGGDDGRVELQVYAASSLTKAFDTLETSYEDGNPGVDVVLTYDASSTLAAQVIENAPVDVLATADETTMATVVDGGLVDGDPEVFATNTLVVVTPADNPAEIESLEDLDGTDFAVCAAPVPCGDATLRLFGRNDFTGTPISEEDNVNAVLEKVTSGTVDAGLVYVSDAQTAGEDVSVVEVDGAEEIVNADPIAVINTTENADEARAWVDLVVSEEGQRVLDDLGFGSPA